jgi:DNA-binding NtrC family response regulator
MIKRPRKGIVLLVDDDQGIRTLFERALSSFGGVVKAEVAGSRQSFGKVRLFAAEDLESAKEIIAKESVALAFIDKNLPDGDGVLFCRELIGTVDFPCYVITGTGTSADCLAALEFGVADYIPKPIHVQKIRDVVRRHVLVEDADRPVGDPMGSRAIKVSKPLPQQLSQQSEDAERRESEFDLVGESAAMIEVAVAVQRVAKTDMPVLIVGESGTGKEVIAKQIHALSNRRDKNFVAVNCAAIPKDLIESELFGHDKGAFTDAKSSRIGLFEEAQGGTIFLDEITSTSLDFQVKLLRVLQEDRMRRVGSNKEIELDVRVIAASNKNPAEEISAGNFREDFYYRLRGSEIQLPRLCEREKDVMALARHFGEQAARRLKKVVYFSEGVKEALERYSWPGNVRELISTIEYAFSRCDSTVLLSDLPLALREEIGKKPFGRLPLAVSRPEDVTRIGVVIDQYALHALDLFDGNKTRAAERLGVNFKFFDAAAERLDKGLIADNLHMMVGKPKRKDGNGDGDDSQSSLFEDVEEVALGA